MAYFLDDNNPDIVVVVNRESKKVPDVNIRIVWSKAEQRFIYGTEEEYHICVGEEEIEVFDTSLKIQELIKRSYKTGVVIGESSFYDDGTCLYEIYDTNREHKLLFDASKL